MPNSASSRSRDYATLDCTPDAGLVRALKRSGWTLADRPPRPDRGNPEWLVVGVNGECVLLAGGKTVGDALLAAADQARALGMFRG